jgi:hypothetical protein
VTSVCQIVFAVVCSLARPDLPEPQLMGYGPATNRAQIPQAFLPPLPVVGPLVAMKPQRPRQRPEKRGQERPEEGLAVLASYAPTRSAVPSRVWRGQGDLFVLSDGNEQTGCLHKNKRLYTAMKKIRAHFGKPLVIESAYRSPAYNAALRKRSKGVAKSSLHMKCAAIDFRISGVPIRTIARYAATLPEVGGIGVYRSWVHVDTGSRRYW